MDFAGLSIVHQTFIFTTWLAGWISEGLRVSRSNSATVKTDLGFPSVVTGLVPNEEWKLKYGEKWYQGDTVNLE